jgi:hypothetical protein
MKFKRTCIALAGATIIVVACAMTPQSATAATAEPTVPYTVHPLSFGDIKEENVPGLYDGPFPWHYMFGFHLAGMVGHDFFKPYAVTFDFQNMQIFLQ